MRLIDADALRDNMQWCIDHGMYDKPYDYLAEIDDAPTIDSVEVVKCKDCRWWSGSANTSHNNHLCKRALDQNVDYWTRGDDYCSCGEHREDGDA